MGALYITSALYGVGTGIWLDSLFKIDNPEGNRPRTVPKVPTEARRLAPIRPTADEAADLYFPRKGTSLGYRHFGTLADALEHVRENLTPGQRAACVIQVGERRLVPGDVARLLLREPVQPMAAG